MEKNLVIIYFFPLLMESRVKFRSYFLELHRKTALQHSPKQPKQMGTCFKMQKKVLNNTESGSMQLIWRNPSLRNP